MSGNVPNITNLTKTCGLTSCGIVNSEAKLCSRCKRVYYCNVECQKKDWAQHKAGCKAPEAQNLVARVTDMNHQDNKGQVGPRTETVTKPINLWENSAPNPRSVSKAYRNLPQGQMKDFHIEQSLVNVTTQFFQNAPNGKISVRGAAYKGLENCDYQSLLNTQNYGELLKHIWSENDIDKVIVFLRPLAEQGHVVLMFDLARALLTKMNSTNTLDDALIQEAARWINLGEMCCNLDAACIEDNSAEGVGSMLSYQYTCLFSQFRSYRQFKPHLDNHLSKEAKLEVIRSWTPQATNPSPRWMRLDCIGAFMGSVSVKPEVEWLELRQKAYREYLEKR